MSLLAALVLQAASSGRQSLGVWERWGAFRDAAPHRCYAIAEPLGPRRATRAFASIATWPSDSARGQFHIRLSRSRAAYARVTLTVGERRFTLIAGATDAWAPDTSTDIAVVAAIRGSRSMTLETLAASGAPFVDAYALPGAATAIDAAAVGCAGR